MKQITLLFLAFAILLASCGSDDSPTKTLDSETIEQYLSDNSLTFSTTSEGAYQYVIASNPGGNSTGDVFSIYYTLTNLESGDLIDSHLVADGDPIKLLRNADAIFPQGLDYGLADILEGESYGIILPDSLGYGDFVVSGVPLGTILHFEVEVVMRESESNIATSEDILINNYILGHNLNDTLDSNLFPNVVPPNGIYNLIHPVDSVVALTNGVYYKRTAMGNGIKVSTGDSITVDYNGLLLDDSSFDSLNGFKYKFGSSSVIPGLDSGVGEMEQSERATIFIPSSQAYGASVRVIPESSIPDLVTQLVVPDYTARVEPYEVLVFDVTLQIIH
ncbi:MAG: hypothetical protein GY816_17905 [Cytophagales bacterium]|nr:hypothetical protein [Cytophagales bacterium]